MRIRRLPFSLLAVAGSWLVSAGAASSQEESGTVGARKNSSAWVNPGMRAESLPIIETLKAQGYDVSVATEVNAVDPDTHLPDTATAEVTFRRTYDGPGQGLLRIPWQRQILGNAQYLCTSEGCDLHNVDVQELEKPPLFGDWKTVAGDGQADEVYQMIQETVLAPDERG